MGDGADLVVIGLGYVGLPLVAEATRAGLRVHGLDLDRAKVEALNAGRSHVDDLSDADIRRIVAAGFHASDDPACLDGAGTVVICVPTPLDASGGPDLAAVEAAGTVVAAHLGPGMLVVLESTTYPGTTEDVLRPLLERDGLRAGVDFHLAYSPERIDPGNARYGLRNTPKVVGGVTPACTDAAATFYSKIVDTVVRVRGTREAEMAKLLENTYRHINIALMNEMAVFCDELDIDLWDVIEAASTKPFGFQAFYPGPGVGGHCIPIDPNYLSYKVRTLGYPFRFVELAQEINVRMPAYVVTRIQRLLNDRERAVKGSDILLLGVTYKPNIADERESPAVPLARKLLSLGARLRYHDPHVPIWRVDGVDLTCEPDLLAAVGAADLVVLVQPHDTYDLDAIVGRAKLIFDTRGRTSGAHVHRL